MEHLYLELQIAKSIICYNLVNINDGSNGAGFVSHVMGNITLINCYSRTNNNRGLITFDDVNGTTTIVNCYNMGTSQNLNHVNNGRLADILVE